VNLLFVAHRGIVTRHTYIQMMTQLSGGRGGTKVIGRSSDMRIALPDGSTMHFATVCDAYSIDRLQGHRFNAVIEHDDLQRMLPFPTLELWRNALPFIVEN
jgi:hypothetical protein